MLNASHAMSAFARERERNSAFGQLSLRLLTAKDVPALMQLRDEVLADLEHPDLYVRESAEPEFVRSHIDAVENSGETIGVFDGNHLVAYGMLGLPCAGDSGNLGRYFSAEQSALKTAHLAGCMVSQRYRGQHLQRMLLKARLELARGRGRSFCVAMTSLHNHASRRNLIREGLRIGWVDEIDGLKRQLLAVDLAKQRAFDHQSSQLVRYDDWDRQRELVRLGWWGVDEHPSSLERKHLACVHLVFAKPRA